MNSFRYGCLLAVLLGTAALAQSNPVPFVNQPLVPTTVTPGSPAFTLTVNGTNFVPTSVVQWNGSARSTTFVDSKRLTASIPAGDVASRGTAAVTVWNPLPGGGTSDSAFLTVANPISTLGFATISYSGGVFPAGMATADFDGDGVLDLALAERGGFDVAVLIGNGDGSFQTLVSYPTGYSDDVKVGDFNRDGKPDLAVINGQSDNVSILLGNGDGTFQPMVAWPTGYSPFDLTIADFDRDGKLDIAVVNQGIGIAVLLGNGDGTFQPPVAYAADAALGIVVGDFNGDGNLDLIATQPAWTKFSVFLGNGDGTFQSPTTVSGGFDPLLLVAADFNGDGKLDLAAGDISNGLDILLGNGDGTFQAVVQYYTFGGTPLYLTVGDLNGDGKLDVAVSNEDSYIGCVFDGRGDGTFQDCTQFTVQSEIWGITIGDFNRDGKLDLAVTQPEATVPTVIVFLETASVFSTDFLAFSTQSIGTGVSRRVIFQNTSDTMLPISSVTIGGANSAEFSQMNNCGTGLAAGASCGIVVTFQPTGSGERTAALVVTEAAGAQQAVQLAGYGTNVGVSPASLNFGNQKIGTSSAPQTITLRNNGTQGLRVKDLGIHGLGAGDFSESTTCLRLHPGASCTISVTFTPTRKGIRSAELNLNFSDSGKFAVRLKGMGTP